MMMMIVMMMKQSPTDLLIATTMVYSYILPRSNHCTQAQKSGPATAGLRTQAVLRVAVC